MKVRTVARAPSVTQLRVNSTKVPDGCEGELYVTIVSMCERRIRGRLKYDKDPPRTRFGELLQTAMAELSRFRVNARLSQKQKQAMESLNTEMDTFMTQSAVVLQLHKEWLLHQVPDRLCVFIEGLLELFASGRVKDVIDLIPDDPKKVKWNKDLRNSLYNMIGKVSRYRAVARVLYRVAKKCPLARRMRAVPIKLPASFFGRTPQPQPADPLQHVLTRVQPRQGQYETMVGRLSGILNISPPSSAEREFTTQAKETLKKGKFHAEVQLLCRILENPTPNPPRVVCASKDACYLCQLALQAYAKIHTPRCHGKLYPGWRLPVAASMQPLQISLNQRLAEKARNSVELALRNGHSRSYPDPAESSVSIAVLSDSTASSNEVESHHTDTVHVTGSTKSSSLSGTVSSNRSRESQLGGDGVAEERQTAEEGVVEEPHGVSSTQADQIPIHHRAQPDTTSSESSFPSTDTMDTSITSNSYVWSVRQSYALAQGEVITSTLPQNTASSVYTSQALELQLEYTGTNTRPSKEPKLRYRIQQLTQREACLIRESSYIPVVEADRLSSAVERSYGLHQSTDLYFGVGDVIFRLVLEPANRG